MAINYTEIPSPCYVLDEKSLQINLELLNLVQQEAGVKIICALKGYSFWYSFPMLRQYLSGATASSYNEARLIAEEMGCEAHTYSPAYKDETFEEILCY